MKCRDPNSSAVVLKEGRHTIIRQSTASLAVNRISPVLPSVQAIIRAKPNAAIRGRQDRHNGVIRQTLLDRNGCDREAAKAVEAITRGYPHIAFSIFKEVVDEVAGEAVRLPKHIGPSPVDMQDPLVRRSDP